MAQVWDADLPIEPLDRAIARLASRQHGVFSREQARAMGATRSMVDHRRRAGRWDQLHTGVFRLAGSPASWRSQVMAACLAWGSPCAASHRTAARVWALPGISAGPVEVLLPVDRRRRVLRTVRRRGPLPSIDRDVVDAIPVTTPTRTLLDLAAVLPAAAVEEALDDAVRRGLTSVGRLAWRLDELGRRPGATTMRALITARAQGPVPQSVFETRLLRAIARGGLPAPDVQHTVTRHARVVAVVDLAYPEPRLAIEADGYRWHSSRARWEHDRQRLNELTALGWRVVHVTWRRFERDPGGVIEEIRSALAAAPSGR